MYRGASRRTPCSIKSKSRIRFSAAMTTTTRENLEHDAVVGRLEDGRDPAQHQTFPGSVEGGGEGGCPGDEDGHQGRDEAAEGADDEQAVGDRQGPRTGLGPGIRRRDQQDDHQVLRFRKKCAKERRATGMPSSSFLPNALSDGR
jgi:hypothetical protein